MVLLLALGVAGGYAAGYLSQSNVLICSGAIAALYVATRMHRRTDELVRFFTLYPLIIIWLGVERTLFPGALTPFPVTIKAIVAKPNVVLALIRDSSALGRRLVGSSAAAVKATVGDELAAEPLKAHSAAVVTFELADGKKFAAFFKTPSARRMPLASFALSVTYLVKPREVGVSQDMMAEVEHEARGEEWRGASFKPMYAPRPLVAVSQRAFGRDLIGWEALDHTKYQVYPDGGSITPQQALLMTTMLARLHAANWTKAHAHRGHPSKLVPYITQRDPMDYIGYVDMIKNKTQLKWVAPLWDACSAYFNKKVANGEVRVVLSHNDFRPGNMMFDKNFVEDSRNVPLTDTQWFAKNMKREHLAVLDWEVFAFSPHFWDVVYLQVGGLSVEDRRAHAPTLLKTYLAELRAQGVPASEIPSYDDAVKHCDVMWLLVPCYCEALVQLGGAGKEWGNAAKDMNAWVERVAAGVLDVTADVPAICKRLNMSESVVKTIREFQTRMQSGEGFVTY